MKVKAKYCMEGDEIEEAGYEYSFTKLMMRFTTNETFEVIHFKDTLNWFQEACPTTNVNFEGNGGFIFHRKWLEFDKRTMINNES